MGLKLDRGPEAPQVRLDTPRQSATKTAPITQSVLTVHIRRKVNAGGLGKLWDIQKAQ